jgi:thiosulfate sulfurtransferase
MHAISATQLNAAWAGPDAPLLLDVRRRAAREASGLQVPGSIWRDPALWLDWKDELAQRSPLVLYCAHGQEISQGLAAALRVMGAHVQHLEGGWSAWLASGLPAEPVELLGD